MEEILGMDIDEKTAERETIRKISLVSLGGNVFLSALKFAGGIFGGSGAMISDGVHSLADVLVTLVAFFGVRLSKKEPDKAHPYGHEKFECLASLLLGLILVFTGVGVGYAGAKNIFSGQYQSLAVPSLFALAAAGASILTKEGMFRYTRKKARQIDSAAFTADAWHHRTDAISSVGSLLGIGGAMLGFPVSDSVASLGICIFILKVAYDIMKDGVTKLIDTACDEDFENSLKAFLEAQPEILQVESLRTRMSGNKIYGDTVVSLKGNPPASETIPITASLKTAVKKAFPEIKEITVEIGGAWLRK